MSASSRPRRRLGCLGRLLVIVLSMGACYWLLLAPLPEQRSEAPEVPTAEAQSGRVTVEGDVTDGQQAALEKLADETGETVDALAQNGQIQFLNLNVKVPDSVAVSDQEKAIYFLNQNPQILQLDDPARTLHYEGRKTNSGGNTSVHFTQQYQGLPVHASSIIVLLDQEGNVINVGANYA